VATTPPFDASSPKISAQELTWSFPETAVGRMSVVVSIPARHDGQKFPVLVTLHGMGEAAKGPARGARGWLDDYWLGRAITRLEKPPLRRADFQNFAEPERLNIVNHALEEHPYAGLVVVMPYTPDVIRGKAPFDKAIPLAKFVVETLLPKVFAETPALATPETTGIDGVSLGGRAALLIGLLHPKSFGSIGSLQAAFDPDDVSELASKLARARRENPRFRLRLLTSQDDYYLEINRQISSELRARQVSHDFLVVDGPHDYAFNRGPGAYEMLLFHDRALRGLPGP
jgi:iron(III)-salmochelin esterase